MNNSNGFQGSSLLGSSTGFKKRALLRPASGMLNKKQQFLRAVDISQSEPAIATLLRSEVAAIDQQINLLDKDKRIRQGEGGLQKSYVTALRKWLRQNQSLGQKEDDQVKIMKHLGVDSYESGFRKLWKIASHLDLVINKVTELQIVNFLLYDDMFDEIGKDSQKSAGVLTSISNNGYTSGTFQITQVLLDRSKDLYASRKNGIGSANMIRLKEQNKGREETSELIAQLKRQNSKLTALLEQLSEEKRNQKTKQQQKQTSKSKEQELALSRSPPPQNISTKQAFKDIQEKYQEQLRYLGLEKSRAEETIADLKSQLSSLSSQLKSNLEAFKDTPRQVPKSGSYQEALMEEMDKMKRGFEKKISILTDEFTSRERQLRKKQAEYKSENEKIKWQKSLLLKKFQFLPQK